MTPATWLMGLIRRVISKDKIQEDVTAEELRAMVRLSLTIEEQCMVSRA
jgi:hypothetical protein